MAPMIGVHEIELKPGASAEEFEQFAREVFLQHSNELPGLTTAIYGGERGARAGKYLVVYSFESAAARDKLFPDGDVLSEEAQRWFDEHTEMWQRWEQLVTDLGGPGYTDYALVAE